MGIAMKIKPGNEEYLEKAAKLTELKLGFISILNQ